MEVASRPSLQPASSSMTSPIPTPASTTPASQGDFRFPVHYSFPPFFTLQPNLTTLARQLALWSALILSYCAHNHLFRLSLSTAANGPLFYNSTLHRRLDLLSIRRVLDYMVSSEGDQRAAWVSSGGKKASAADSKSSAWIYWKRPEKWADLIYGWVDETGQRGSVLTVYELRESDAVSGAEWAGMDEELLLRCLDVLVKRGKAQVFGSDDSVGCKFF